jgi:hypothetical protein
MVSSSFFTDGGVYDTSVVETNDHAADTTPSQAPSSFYPSGGIYDALADSDTVIAEMQALEAQTEANAAAASTSATSAATSAANAATSAANSAAAVQGAAGTATPLVDGTAAVGTSTKWAHEDHRHPTDTSRADATATTAALALKAPLASPALTGTPTAPTATAGTNTTQLATTAFVNSEAVRYDAAQSLTNAQKAQARSNLDVSARGYLNILDFGGVGDGSTTNDTAFENAWTALVAAGGGAIYFPAGVHVFSSRISKTFPASQYSVTLVGDGSAGTVLHWPNASGGMQFTKAHVNNTIHIRDMSVTTAQVGGGKAIELIGTGHNAQVQCTTSDIQDVQIQGNDFAEGSGSHYWDYGVFIHCWSGFLIKNLNVNGVYGAPNTSGTGNGICVEGDTGTTAFTTWINLVSCSFNYNHVGVLLGSYWQGVIVDDCNFNGITGIAGIHAPTGGVDLAGLTVKGSQINAGQSQILLESAVADILVFGNIITIAAANCVGVYLQHSGNTQFTITGNVFNTLFSPSPVYAVIVYGNTGTITGNVFTNFGSTVVLQASSTRVTVALNSYQGVSTAVTNSGTGNSIGGAFPGTMTGVVP